MSELEKKFKEYYKKIDMVTKPLKAILKDLAEIAEKEYEIVNIANVYICKERNKLEKENTELKNQVKELLGLNKEWKEVYAQERIAKSLYEKENTELKKRLELLDVRTK